MFRKMRRFKQMLSQEECEQILTDATHGVLGVIGDDGYPYTVPLSHVYRDGKIYFHCAWEGHKIDAIRENEKVSFCVVAQDRVMAKERTTAYISVIAFGKARIIEDEAGLRQISWWIADKFSRDYPDLCREEIEEVVPSGRMYCVEITVEHLTGKAGNEVFRERREAQKGIPQE